MAYAEARAGLTQLAALPAGWDGYGSEPIKPEILTAATQLLDALPDLPAPLRAVPMTRGRLQFEAHAATRSLEIELLTPTTAVYLASDGDEDDEGTFLVQDAHRAAELVRWFANA